MFISRLKRVWYPGAVYHLMGRGIRRTAIFRQEDDYYLFMKLLEKTKEKYGFTLHTYCLMTNHFHIQITTKDKEVWHIMKYLLNNYSRMFNQKYGYSGHLFDSRYNSCLIEDGVYFLEVSRYIHLNPIRVKMVREPLDYKYSSYRTYMGNEKNELVDCTQVLSHFMGDQKEQYRMFVEGAVSHQEYETLIMTDMKEDEQWLPW